MLNEWLEYVQYTYLPEGKTGSARLKHKTICNQLAGITRAMTIVARKHMFEYDGPERFVYAKKEIRMWCGDISAEEAKSLSCCWLPRYLILILGAKHLDALEKAVNERENETDSSDYSRICNTIRVFRSDFDPVRVKDSRIREKLEEEAEELKKLCKDLDKEISQPCKSLYKVTGALLTLYSRFSPRGFSKRMFDTRTIKSEQNDFKQIMYDRILADALAEGPLKRYYLVCKENGLSQITFESKQGNHNVVAGPEHKWSVRMKTKADIIMKATAVYLLELNARGSAGCYGDMVPVNKTDLYNWIVSNTNLDTLHHYYIDNRQLFSDVCKANVSYMSIDSDWMKSCGWKVIEEEELDSYLKENPDAIFYSDFGCEKYLRKRVRYD